jgi:hypothetical protein
MGSNPIPSPPTEKRVAAVDAPEAADRTKVGMVEGGFILRSECISRVIKFDSKQNKTNNWFSFSKPLSLFELLVCLIHNFQCSKI